MLICRQRREAKTMVLRCTMCAVASLLVTNWWAENNSKIKLSQEFLQNPFLGCLWTMEGWPNQERPNYQNWPNLGSFGQSGFWGVPGNISPPNSMIETTFRVWIIVTTEMKVALGRVYSKPIFHLTSCILEKNLKDFFEATSFLSYSQPITLCSVLFSVSSKEYVNRASGIGTSQEQQRTTFHGACGDYDADHGNGHRAQK